MELQRRLMADLSLLTEALDSDTVDLAHLALRLVSDIDDAVSSVVSVTLTMTIDGEDFELAALAEDPNAREAASSLCLTLTGRANSRATTRLLIRSGTAGALVDFAADVSFSLGLDSAAAVLDGHLRRRTQNRLAATEVGYTLAAMSEINQAVGVLIESGRTPPEGRAELRRLALASSTPLIEVARQVLRDALGWHPPQR